MRITILIVFLLGCICLMGSIEKNDKPKKPFILGTVLSMVVLYILGELAVLDKNCIIPAIEVYRGNTVLQMTYQDSIPVDSVVVYKKK